jgi:hypothetical protein
MNFWEKLFAYFDRKPKQLELTDTRAPGVFKTQEKPKDPELELSELEQGIADEFDHLPRQCRRAVERMQPKSWQQLDAYCKPHLVSGHKPGGKSCR